jgi:hypothetical protein
VNYFQSSVNPRTVVSVAAAGTTPSMFDIATFVSEGLIAPLMQGLSQAAVNFSDTMGSLAARPMRASRNRAQKHGCGCETQDPCHCTCCISDADVVVYAYLGERRVATFSIENERCREKDIRVVLGEFTTRAGKPAPIIGMLEPPTEFKLGRCASQIIVMMIDTGSLAASGGEAKNALNAERMTDVENCTVYYSDLRVDGCEMRPLRLAVAILPRDCGAYKIQCRCCCCCC